MARMVLTQYHSTADQLERLKRLSCVLRINRSELIRMAVERLLAADAAGCLAIEVRP